MKRWNRYSSTHNDNTELLELDIEVFMTNEAINGSTILDITDPAFFDFESNIMLACELHDFELEDSYQSNRKDSVSQYYIYTKTNEEGTKLRVFLKLRVSDHSAPDRTFHGKHVSQNKLSTDYTKEEAKRIAEERFNQKRGYRARLLDIIFDDEHYTSYEKALRDIEDRLDDFDPEV